MKNRDQELWQLENILALTPGNIYWLDRDGIFQGCNQNQLRLLGLASIEEYIGKTYEDLLDPENAKLIRSIDEEIMNSGKIITLEEPGLGEHGKQAIYSATKQPLFDEAGHVVGLLGVSIDITDQKAFEKKLREQEVHEAEFKANQTLKIKQALIDSAAQVSHDIRSPLAALNTVLRALPNIPENQRILIRNAVARINDIANNLLAEYRDDPSETPNGKTAKPTSQLKLASSLLDTLISEKKMQIENKRIELSLDINEDSFGIFLLVDPIQFRRVISNLLNNAIEAISEAGEVTVTLAKGKNRVYIRIKDTGKGMPNSVLQKVKKGGFSHQKASGSGIGIASAIAFIKNSGGAFDITSKPGIGTEVELEFPLASTPAWFQEKLTFAPNTTVVILDDDESIHGIWTSRCQPLLSQITLKHFHQPESFREFCMNNNLENTQFLMDFELLGSDTSGLDLIEELKLNKKAILVTSRYEEPTVRQKAKDLGVKITPKNYSPYIDIALADSTQPQLIFIDDSKPLTDAWKLAADLEDIPIQTYNTIDEFRTILPSLSKKTPIYIDSDLGESVSGEAFAKELYELGYTELYLASGHPREYFGDLPWIKKFVGKEPPFQDN